MDIDLARTFLEIIRSGSFIATADGVRPIRSAIRMICGVPEWNLPKGSRRYSDKASVTSPSVQFRRVVIYLPFSLEKSCQVQFIIAMSKVLLW